jgi:hypothetical protein
MSFCQNVELALRLRIDKAATLCSTNRCSSGGVTDSH